jgi:hypothetical protein
MPTPGRMRQVLGVQVARVFSGLPNASHEIQVPRKNAVGKLPTTTGAPSAPWKHERIQFLLDKDGEVLIISTPQ